MHRDLPPAREFVACSELKTTERGYVAKLEKKVIWRSQGVTHFRHLAISRGFATKPPKGTRTQQLSSMQALTEFAKESIVTKRVPLGDHVGREQAPVF
jgi:hypothetical protein